MINERNHAVEVSSDILAPFLFGHAEQIALILRSIKTNKIPNAWLFHGPLGIGKASLALNVAKILSNIDLTKPGYGSGISESDIRNPKTSFNLNNVFHCKRKWDDKKKVFQKYISIDDIRELNKRFSLSSTDHSYKVCVIDTTEDLNLSASNSLLKILEEPPKNTLFILVSNNQQAILPTILSRCQKVGFEKLEEQSLREISAEIFKKNQFSDLEEANFLSSCEGSARKLINFLDKDYIDFFNDMKTLLSNLPNINRRQMITLLAKNREYLYSNDPDKSAFGIILRLIGSIAKQENVLRINKSIKPSDTSLIAAHLYSQISLLRHYSIEYNVDMKKVVFLALTTIELAFEKYKQR